MKKIFKRILSSIFILNFVWGGAVFLASCSSNNDEEELNPKEEPAPNPDPINYSSLQEKLDAAESGATVSLTADDFSEENLSLTLTKAITVTAEEQIDSKKAEFTVKASGVTLKNLTSVKKITVASEVGDGEFYLDNCEVDSVDAYGGGENSFYLIGAIINELFSIFKDGLHVQQQSGGSIHTVAVNADKIHLDAKDPGETAPKFSNVHLKDDVHDMKIGGKAKIENLFADNYETKVTIASNEIELDSSGTKTEEGDIIQADFAFADDVDSSTITLNVIDDRKIDDIASEINGTEILPLTIDAPSAESDGVHFKVNVPVEGVHIANIMRKDAANTVYATAVQAKSKNATQLPVGELELIDYFTESGKEYTYYVKFKNHHLETTYRTEEFVVTATGGAGELVLEQVPEALFDSETEEMNFSKTLKFSPETPPGKMLNAYEKSVSNESARWLAYVPKDAENNDVKATIYFSNVEEGEPTPWSMSGIGNYELYGVRYGFGYEENGVRIQSWKWLLAKTKADYEQMSGKLPDEITFTEVATQEAKEDGIHIIVNALVNAKNIEIQRYEEDMDTFGKVMNLSNPTPGDKIDFVDYFVEPNKEYTYYVGVSKTNGTYIRKNLDKIISVGGSGLITVSTDGVSLDSTSYDSNTGILTLDSLPSTNIPNAVDFDTTSMRYNFYILNGITSISTTEIPVTYKKVSIGAAVSSDLYGKEVDVAKYISVRNIAKKVGNYTFYYSRYVPRPTNWLDKITLPSATSFKNIIYFDYGEIEATSEGILYTVDMKKAFEDYPEMNRFEITTRPKNVEKTSLRRNVQFRSINSPNANDTLVYLEKFVEQGTQARTQIQFRKDTTDFASYTFTLTPNAGSGVAEIDLTNLDLDYNETAGAALYPKFNKTTTPKAGCEPFLTVEGVGQTEEFTFTLGEMTYTPALKNAYINQKAKNGAGSETNFFQIYSFATSKNATTNEISVNKDSGYSSGLGVLLKNTPSYIGKTLTHSQTAFVKNYYSDDSSNKIEVQIWLYNNSASQGSLPSIVNNNIAGKTFSVLGHDGATLEFANSVVGTSSNNDKCTYNVTIKNTEGKTISDTVRIDIGKLVTEKLYIIVLSNDRIALCKRDNNKFWNETTDYDFLPDTKTVKYGNTTYSDCTAEANVLITGNESNPFYADWGGYVCRDGFGELSFSE